MKLIVLDRDGTINADRKDFVKSPDEWLPLPGSLEAIARLNQAGWHVMLATNQSGLGRGLFDMDALVAMHGKMQKMLAAVGGRIDAIFMCPHVPEDGCNCRKPLPGMFEQIALRSGVPAKDIITAGDSLRDLQAAASAGCQVNLVCTGNAAGLKGQALPPEYPPQTRMHDDLAAFADYVITQASLAESA